MAKYDYIIVGAGTAGCVLADRLSQEAGNRILLLEAGGDDKRFWIKTPIGYGRTFADPTVNWKYQTEVSPGLNGRSMYWPRGKVLGGSSSINALVYCRGLPEDFDGWRDLGNPGWGFADVKRYFERSERKLDEFGHQQGEGPMDVLDVSSRLHPIGENWRAAAQELDYALTDDFNGDSPEGFGNYHITVRQGLRRSAADAFLRPALKRGNVDLKTEALVGRIRFEGRRATGVEYSRGGEHTVAEATRSVLLCGGTVNSPQLLQLSGVGSAALLKAQGIGIVIDNANVGAHLQDHLAVVYSYRATRPTLNNVLGRPVGQLLAGIRYLLARSGPLSLSVNQFGALVRANPAAPKADMQLYFNPVTYSAGDAKRTRIKVDKFAGFYLCFQPTRPTSVGRIEIASSDSKTAPKIFPNYMSTDKDREDAVQGARLIQRIARTQAMRGLIQASLPPDLERMSEADMLQDFLSRAATVYHPVGTCRMGSTPADSVVDASLKVHGVEGLRVIDASVFPTVTSANTNAPTMMVAQKAADLLHETR